MSQQLHRIPKGMKPGRRELNEASLRISMTDAVPAHMRQNMREISHLFVAHNARRQRLGTMLMNLVCQEADANRLTLLLTARPSDDDGAPEEALVAWYQKFGFVKIQDTPRGFLMARQVQERTRVLAVRDNVVSLAVRRAMLEAQAVH